MGIKLTYHARIRQQQRCIPNGIIGWLVDYGQRYYDHHEGVRVVFSRASIRALTKAYGQDVTRALEGFNNAYLVLSVEDGSVITTGYIHGGKKSPRAA
jgi:hypothetical protein